MKKITSIVVILIILVVIIVGLSFAFGRHGVPQRSVMDHSAPYQKGPTGNPPPYIISATSSV